MVYLKCLYFLLESFGRFVKVLLSLFNLALPLLDSAVQYMIVNVMQVIKFISMNFNITIHTHFLHPRIYTCI